jgi:hypothetical protein
MEFQIKGQNSSKRNQNGSRLYHSLEFLTNIKLQTNLSLICEGDVRRKA